jgi:hypothetical protein
MPCEFLNLHGNFKDVETRPIRSKPQNVGKNQLNNFSTHKLKED